MMVPLALFAAALVAAWALRRLPRLTRAALAAVAIASVALALVMTMRPAPGALPARPRPVLNPWTTLEVVVTGSGVSFPARMEALGNLLVMMPLGVSLGLLLGWRVAVAACAGLSLAVELAQWVLATGRTADATDLLLNTAGGCLGAGIAAIAVRLTGAGLANDTQPR